MLRRALCFVTLLVMAARCNGILPSSQTVKDTVGQLSQGEQELLAECFRVALTESEAGAVLFGNKPICIDGTPATPNVPNYLLGWSSALAAEHYKQGLEVWSRVAQKGQRYSFIRCSQTERQPGAIDCLWVNHSALLKVVRTHLPLFQMVLGPQVTPESLLAALTTPDINLYETLGNNKVLIGLVLGYGLDNALTQSRAEQIELALDASETFPLRALEDRYQPQGGVLQMLPHYVTWEFPPGESLEVSLGFESVVDEYEQLRAVLSGSRSHPLAKGHDVPIFGCLEDSRETRRLIKGYVKASKRTQQVLNSGQVLEEVLAKLCG